MRLGVNDDSGEGPWVSSDRGGCGGSVVGTIQPVFEGKTHDCATPGRQQPAKYSSSMGLGKGRAAVASDPPEKVCSCSKCMDKPHIQADAF